MNKIDIELLLSMSLDNSQRVKNEELSIGYSENTNDWKVLIKYIGDIRSLSEKYSFKYKLLLSNYAVVWIARGLIESLEEEFQIIWVEKANLYYGLLSGWSDRFRN